MKLWDKGKKVNEQVENFTVGNDYILDHKLVGYDCMASIAHAKMLGKIGILNDEEVTKLVDELEQIFNLHLDGKFEILKEHEDCHTAIENHLIEKLGDLGKKIHTGRSRNDQVLTALRLYYKDELISCKSLCEEFTEALAGYVNKYGHIEFPGYTHTRKAMPSAMSLWGVAFIESMKDNIKAIDFALELIDQSPLGTGAGYGVPVEIDREFTAKLLGFRKIQRNPIYVQNSRGKFESNIVHALSLIMFDLNKIATDLILFSMPEFGYFELSEDFCTGSSIMPQKKNPDVLELVRAKYHVLISLEMQLKNIIGNLVSGYHRDLQLTKDAIMQAFEITESCLSIMCLLIKKLKVNEENCRRALTEELFATERVLELVKQGMPFREAYKIISKDY